MNNAQLINQTSGEQEYYTPQFIIEAARATMGGIDLDPASSEVANATIGATHIYTIETDGLAHEWFGRVWMNHPFGRLENNIWPARLLREFHSGRVTQACCLTFAATSEKWFQPFYNYPMCFLSPRTNFLTPDGKMKKGVTKGSVVVYLGANAGEFQRQFAPFGGVMRPY